MEFAASLAEFRYEFVDATYSFTNQFDELSVSRLAGIAATIEVSEFESSLMGGVVWDDLDSAKRDFMMHQLQIGVPAIAASAASFLTVGYLAWIIRGGVLLTTMMSSIPAWSSFDILSVLESADGDESIEQMVDH